MRIDTRRRAGPSLRWGALVAALSLTACGGSSTTTTTSPTAPTTTDSFTGTLAAGGVDLHNFTVAQAGTLTVTLASVSPQSTITMGLGVGQPSGTTCPLFSDTETARMGSMLQGTIDVGSYCVEIYDLGNVQGSDTYTITVDHP